MNLKLRTSIIIAAAIVAAGAIIGVSIAFVGSKRPSLAYLAVSRGDLRHEVRLTGSVRPVESVDLAFERGGRLIRVATAVGDKVVRGQAVAFLDSADLAAQESQAQAVLEGAVARLADLKRGLRPEESALLDLKVSGAEDTVRQTEVSAVNAIAAAYAVVDDAVRGKIDQFVSNPTGLAPRLTFFVADEALKTQFEWNRRLIEDMLKRWQFETSALTSDSDLIIAVETAKRNLAAVKDFLNAAALVVDKIDLKSNPSLTESTVAGYKSSLSLARANITAVTAAGAGVEQQMSAAEMSLKLASSDRTLKLAGASSEAVAAQAAAVHQAEAALESVRVQSAKTVLRSPLDGAVTRQDGHVGQIVSSNSPLISIVSDQAFEIKTEASEIEVADIHVGDVAKVTLDAYGQGTVFDATVVTVDPAESSKIGAPSYEVTLHFKAADGRIKSGMTANVTVVAGTRTGVIVISRQAVILRGDKTFVMVETASGPTEREVTIGLSGSDSRVEVLSGLAENDRIADFGGRQ